MIRGRVQFASAGFHALAARSFSRLLAVRAALGGFVRGFVGAANLLDGGVPAGGLQDGGGHAACLPGGCGHDRSRDAASARAALSEVAARRGRCC
jgi:hypothetical protein